MQNFAPDAMRLNKFVHVELPDNSQLFLRMQGKSLPTPNPDVQQADFFTRKTEQFIQKEQEFLEDYQKYANDLEQENQRKLQEQLDKMQKDLTDSQPEV